MYTEPPVMQECRGKQAGVGRRRTGACWPAGSEGRGLDDKASGREARAAGLAFVPRAAEAITAEGYGLL